MNPSENALIIAQAGQDGGAVGAIVGLIFVVAYFAVLAAVIVGMWKMFEKAGKPGWGAIIPFYNIILLLEIAGKPLWWIILLLIPLVNVIVAILVMMEVAKNFGKGAGFGLGLAFLGFIFIPILGFGDAKYQPAAS